MTLATASDRKVAVVSGGSRGLGRILVERLLSDGWGVATFSRSSNSFISEMSSTGTDYFLWEAADMSAPESVSTFAKDAVAHFGRVDLLVNNAGALRQGLFLTTPSEQIGSLITINLVAPITLTQACARAMSRGTGGAIVGVSSINAIRGHRGVAVYSAAKAGIEGFNRSLARELGPLNIRVNAVVPGFFDSEMTAEVTDANRQRILRRTPLRRMATVEDVANAVLFLASPSAAVITGQTIVVDGGITC
jgi:3-oxoacyl-[acyl-carrier protein] reductase